MEIKKVKTIVQRELGITLCKNVIDYLGTRYYFSHDELSVSIVENDYNSYITISKPVDKAFLDLWLHNFRELEEEDITRFIKYYKKVSAISYSK